MREWGGWLRSKGDGQGWGGSLDLDRLFELAKAARNQGEYSDPVAAQYDATRADGQDQHQRVDRFVRLSGPLLHLTGVLRYAGYWEPTEAPEYRDRVRHVVSHGRIAGEIIEMGGPVWFRESGPLPTASIALLMECGRDTVTERLSRLHETIRAELIQEARTRKTQRATRRKAA